jgi:S-DNA-T family DNA segregation ATPase FtsK/SpoIIIE
VDKTQGWASAAAAAKSSVTNKLDALTPAFVPFAARWDAEADRRAKLRTPEHLKSLMAAQRNNTSARSTAATAKSQRQAARKASNNPLGSARRAAATADRAARKHKGTAKGDLKAARRDYPATLGSLAVRVHLAHLVPASLASWALSTPQDWTVWPASVSVGLVGLNAAALWLGRRQPSVVLDGDLSAEERQLVERLDPAHWVAHVDDRGLSGTVTTPPVLTSAGIECAVRLDGKWTVKTFKAAEDNVRALLGAKTSTPMLIKSGSRGGWAVIVLRTRSATDGVDLAWTPGASWGVDMVTGEDVDVPLGDRMLIAGMSGAGKSVTARPLLFKASDGETNALVIIDLKKVEGRLWDHRARVASTPEDVIRVVAELVEEMTERLDVLPKGQATLVPTAERPRITVVVDEGAEVMTVVKEALEGLESTARMGRAACMDLWWMTQSPTYGDGVPRQIAKQLGTRIGLAVDSPTEARVVFGESAQEKGWKADELPKPGVALLKNGKRKPSEIKVRFMTDEQVIGLPDRPLWSREVSPDALSLVKGSPASVDEEDLTDNQRAVLEAVRGGASTNAAIATAASLHPGSVTRAVTALEKLGLVAKSGTAITLGGAA